jgi:hypothetical protein
MEFIRINNRNNFLLKEIPEYHPSSRAYLNFWREQKRRCIEGFWSIDDSEVEINVELGVETPIQSKKWRFATPNLYFYVNFGIILHKPDNAPKSAPKKKIRPLLRDVEWEFFYNWLECRGFSGFKDDEVYSCNIELKVHKDNPDYNFDKTCYNSKEELKTYIPAREYLRQLHDKPLGLPLYQNPALDFFWLSARGIGKSFLGGVGVVLHEILFDGAKEYTEDSIKNPYKVEVFVGAALSSKSADILKKTEEAMLNLPGEYGVSTDSYSPSPFYKKMSGTLNPNNQKNPWRHEYEKKMGGTWKTCGSGSNVKHGIYTTENAEAAAGGRYSVMLVEECGLLPNALTVHGSNDATMQDAPWKFGSALWIGTGGNVDKIQEFEVMFKDPEGFNALAFEDDWENSGKIGWFVPAIYAMNDYKDENGNTKVEEALAVRKAIREKKGKAKDQAALALEMMNYPLVPSEMFLNAKSSRFPQAELKAHLATVKSRPAIYHNSHYFGELVWQTDGTLKFEVTNDHNLVTEFPIKNNKDKPGIIEIVVMPKKGADGAVIPNRYIIGTDTYDDDESNTKSLGSCIVLDTFTDRIVAEYTGRPETKEFYEITRKLTIFYRASHNYEKNKKGLYGYYENKNSTHLLCDTPEILKDVVVAKMASIGNQAKGTAASGPVNAYALRLIKSWLLEPAYGEPKDSGKLNLHTIENIGILQELMNFNDTGNFDRVSALGMVMILREDKLKFITSAKAEKSKTLSEDDFFSRNYDKSVNLGDKFNVTLN